MHEYVCAAHIYTAIYQIYRLYNCKLSRKHFILNYIFSQLIYIHKYVCVCSNTHSHTHTHTRWPQATGHWPPLATGNGNWRLAAHFEFCGCPELIVR